MIEKTGKEYRTLLSELSNVLADRTHVAAKDSIDLRDAVCAYVAIEHARGTPLQGVIETVKEILRKAEAGMAGATGTTNALAQQLIEWCMEFHPGTLPRGPRALTVIS